MSTQTQAYQKCINIACGAEYDCSEVYFKCPACGDLLDVKYNWDKIQLPKKLSDFGKRWATRDNRLDFSGVWRFRELLRFLRRPVSKSPSAKARRSCSKIAAWRRN